LHVGDDCLYANVEVGRHRGNPFIYRIDTVLAWAIEISTTAPEQCEPRLNG
jgi:hypothetical protein